MAYIIGDQSYWRSILHYWRSIILNNTQQDNNQNTLRTYVNQMRITFVSLIEKTERHDVLVFILVFVFVFYLCFYFFLYLYLCLCLFLYLILYLLPHKWQQEEANVWEVIGECALNFVSNLYLVLNSRVCRALDTLSWSANSCAASANLSMMSMAYHYLTWMIVWPSSVPSFLFSRSVLPFFID